MKLIVFLSPHIRDHIGKNLGKVRGRKVEQVSSEGCAFPRGRLMAWSEGNGHIQMVKWVSTFKILQFDDGLSQKFRLEIW
jgi:hypothetical protein